MRNGSIGALILAILIFGGLFLGIMCTERIPTGYVGIGCQDRQRVFHHGSTLVEVYIPHEPTVQQAFLALQFQRSMHLCQQALDAVHIPVHLLIGQANQFGIAVLKVATGRHDTSHAHTQYNDMNKCLHKVGNKSPQS